MLKKIFFCIVFVIYLRCLGSRQNYGPFVYRASKAEVCKGPKRIDCCNATVKMKNGKIMTLNMDFKSNMIPNRGKVIVTVNGEVLARLQIKKPCNYFFVRPLVQNFLNATQECEVKKGLYNFSLDLDSLAQEFYGGIFFYGKLIFKAIVHNENCNFICLIVESIVSPKTS